MKCELPQARATGAFKRNKCINQELVRFSREALAFRSLMVYWVTGWVALGDRNFSECVAANVEIEFYVFILKLLS